MSKSNIFISSSRQDHLDLNELRLDLEDAQKVLELIEKRKLYSKCYNWLLTQRRDISSSIAEGEGQASFFVSQIGERLEEWRFNQKKELLGKLLKLTSILIDDYNEVAQASFIQAEKEFDNYISDFSECWEWDTAHFNIPSFEDFFALGVVNKIRTLKIRVGVLLGKIFRRTYRDIRQSIRNIIRFLFQVDSDDSDATDVIDLKISMTLVNNLNHLKDGKEANFKTIICT